MPRYSFQSSSGKGDPRYDDLELADSAAASRMASQFAREVLANDPADEPTGDFFSVKVLLDQAELFTVLTFRGEALFKRACP